ATNTYTLSLHDALPISSSATWAASSRKSCKSPGCRRYSASATRKQSPSPASLSKNSPKKRLACGKCGAQSHVFADPGRMGEHKRSEEHTSELQSRFDLV